MFFWWLPTKAKKLGKKNLNYQLNSEVFSPHWQQYCDRIYCVIVLSFTNQELASLPVHQGR